MKKRRVLIILKEFETVLNLCFKHMAPSDLSATIKAGIVAAFKKLREEILK